MAADKSVLLLLDHSIHILVSASEKLRFPFFFLWPSFLYLLMPIFLYLISVLGFQLIHFLFIFHKHLLLQICLILPHPSRQWGFISASLLMPQLQTWGNGVEASSKDNQKTNIICSFNFSLNFPQENNMLEFLYPLIAWPSLNLQKT